MNLNVQPIIEYLSNEPTVSAAYLFGSFAKGTARDNSDVDIAVLFNRGLSKEKRFDLRLELAVELEDILNRPADVIDLLAATYLLQHQVLTYGRLLLEKDHYYRVEFEVRSRREYFDFKYILERHQKAALSKL